MGADAAAAGAEALGRARRLDRHAAMLARPFGTDLRAPVIALTMILPVIILAGVCFAPGALLGGSALALAFVRTEANDVDRKLVSEKACATVLALVLEAHQKHYLEAWQRARLGKDG